MKKNKMKQLVLGATAGLFLLSGCGAQENVKEDIQKELKTEQGLTANTYVKALQLADPKDPLWTGITQTTNKQLYTSDNYGIDAYLYTDHTGAFEILALNSLVFDEEIKEQAYQMVRVLGDNVSRKEINKMLEDLIAKYNENKDMDEEEKGNINIQLPFADNFILGLYQTGSEEETSYTVYLVDTI